MHRRTQKPTTKTWRNSDAVIGEVDGSATMETFVDQGGHLECQPPSNRQPVQIHHYRCDVVVFTTLSLGNDIIPVSSSARNLDFIFDSDMSFTDQINSLSKSCQFHIRDIRRIRHLQISFLFLQLQRLPIPSSLARVVTNTSKFEHITPILKKLHWLPIKQRIDYKLCLLTYKTLQIQQPTYLYNSLPFPSHSLSTRTSDSSVLSIPFVENLWVKGSLFQDSGTPSHQTPVTRYLFLHSAQNSKPIFSC